MQKSRYTEIVFRHPVKDEREYAERIREAIEEDGLEDNAETRDKVLDGAVEDDIEEFYVRLNTFLEHLYNTTDRLVSFGTVDKWHKKNYRFVPKAIRSVPMWGSLMSRDCLEVERYGFKDGVFFIDGYHHDGGIYVRLVQARKNRVNDDDDTWFISGLGNVEQWLRGYTRKFTNKQVEATVNSY